MSMHRFIEDISLLNLAGAMSTSLGMNRALFHKYLHLQRLGCCTNACMLCNFCSREHPLREVISGHFSLVKIHHCASQIKVMLLTHLTVVRRQLYGYKLILTHWRNISISSAPCRRVFLVPCP
jgi:hypothetical protein